MTSARSLALALILIAFPLVASGQQSALADSLLSFIARYTPADSLRANALNQLAFELHLNEPASSLQYAYEALAISKRLDYQPGEAQGLRQIGLVAWTQANYSQALKNFFDGLKVAEAARLEQVVADINGNIGLVYHGLGDDQEALKYHQRSLEIQRKLKNKTRESVALNNTGDAYRGLKQYEEAIRHYQMALRLRREARNMAGVSTNIRNIGNVYEAQGQFDQALQQYFISMQISDSLQEKRGMSQCRSSIASVYFKQKKYDLAARFINASIDLSRQANFRSYIRDAYLLLSQIHEAQGNTTRAFEDFKTYSQYKDSVVSLQVSSEIASQRLAYETQKKQIEIDLLRKDAVIQESQIGRQNTIIVMVTLSMLFLVVIFIMLFRNFNFQKKTNLALAEKNREIEVQNREIAAQRDELVALNEEITAQQEDLVSSRDDLARKNLSIAMLNENLEKIVQERTDALERQNKQMLEYAFINAHKVRAPLARILGLSTLLTFDLPRQEQEKVLGLLKEAAAELDEVTRSVTDVLQKGLESQPVK